jgi:hypothetical protein
MHYRKTDCWAIGYWQNSHLNGYGEFRWKDGRKYMGEFINNEREGFGIHKWPNTMKAYIGFWKGNKQHGIGCAINGKIIKYGFWENGDRLRWFDSEHEAYQNIQHKRHLPFRKFFRKSYEEVMEFLEIYT